MNQIIQITFLQKKNTQSSQLDKKVDILNYRIPI